MGKRAGDPCWLRFLCGSAEAMAYALCGFAAAIWHVCGYCSCYYPALLGSSAILWRGQPIAFAMILFTTLGQLIVGGVFFLACRKSSNALCVWACLATGLFRWAWGWQDWAILLTIFFCCACGLHHGCGCFDAVWQIKNALGLTVPAAAGFFPQLFATAQHLPSAHPYSMAIAAGTLLCSWLLRRCFPRLPNALLSLMFIAALCAALGAAGQGVRFAAAMPQGLPPFSLPPTFDFAVINDLLRPAFHALMGALEH